MSGLIESKRDYTADVAVRQSPLNVYWLFFSLACHGIIADMLRWKEIGIVSTLTDSSRSHLEEIAADNNCLDDTIYQP
jgi:hypothetical protein